MLIETKVRKTRKREMKVSVFDACNEISKISNALRSRFSTSVGGRTINSFR